LSIPAFAFVERLSGASAPPDEQETTMSCVPSVAWPPDAATKLALVALHLLAAAIIVPVLVRHAND
jgi:hypothetical protein